MEVVQFSLGPYNVVVTASMIGGGPMPQTSAPPELEHLPPEESDVDGEPEAAALMDGEPEVEAPGPGQGYCICGVPVTKNELNLFFCWPCWGAMSTYERERAYHEQFNAYHDVHENGKGSRLTKKTKSTTPKQCASSSSSRGAIPDAAPEEKKEGDGKAGGKKAGRGKACGAGGHVDEKKGKKRKPEN